MLVELCCVERVLIPEMNMGQLRRLIRSEFLVDAHGFNQVNGLPFRTRDLAGAITDELARLKDDERDDHLGVPASRGK